MKNEIDVRRLAELDSLLKLIQLAGSLNTSTNIIGKISNLEKIAVELQAYDYRTPRASFVNWLNNYLIEKFNEHEND